MDLGTYIFICIIAVMYAFSIAYMDKRIDELREFDRRIERKIDDLKFKRITTEEIVIVSDIETRVGHL